jgi:hypothetical protein
MKKAAGSAIVAVLVNARIWYLSTKKTVNFLLGVGVLISLVYHLGILGRLLIEATLRAHQVFSYFDGLIFLYFI